MSRKDNYLELIKTILVANLLNAPEHMKKRLPSILSKPTPLFFSFATKEYLIVSIIDSKERERIALKNRYLKTIVRYIKDDEDVKRFFVERGYKLKRMVTPHDEFEGEKKVMLDKLQRRHVPTVNT